LRSIIVNAVRADPVTYCEAVLEKTPKGHITTNYYYALLIK
jgi:hypothetical protein